MEAHQQQAADHAARRLAKGLAEMVDGRFNASRLRTTEADRARSMSEMRMRWLTGWITDPSPWIDIALFVAVVGAVVFMIWAVFG